MTRTGILETFGLKEREVGKYFRLGSDQGSAGRDGPFSNSAVVEILVFSQIRRVSFLIRIWLSRRCFTCWAPLFNPDFRAFNFRGIFPLRWRIRFLIRISKCFLVLILIRSINFRRDGWKRIKKQIQIRIKKRIRHLSGKMPRKLNARKSGLKSRV